MLLSTFVAFGVITIALYLLVLRPMRPADRTHERMVGRQTPVAPNTPRNRTRQAGTAAAAASAASTQNAATTSNCDKADSNIDKILAENAAFPDHVARASYDICRNGGFNLLNSEGLVAFRHTKAAGYEKSSQQATTSAGGYVDIAAKNRKDRAKILSRMLNLDKDNCDTTPPPRGSTLVVSVPVDHVACPKLRNVLYLLATYYNLLVILVVTDSKKEVTFKDVEQWTKTLRGDTSSDAAHSLVPDVLPSHRIAAASTATGRVAFVRQLTTVELVLDFDAEVKKQLTRFGFRVVQYSNNTKTAADAGDSPLGNQLLS